MIFSFESVDIASLLVPLGGMNPKDFRVFTVLSYRQLYVAYISLRVCFDEQ